MYSYTKKVCLQRSQANKTVLFTVLAWHTTFAWLLHGKSPTLHPSLLHSSLQQALCPVHDQHPDLCHDLERCCHHLVCPQIHALEFPHCKTSHSHQSWNLTSETKLQTSIVTRSLQYPDSTLWLSTIPSLAYLVNARFKHIPNHNNALCSRIRPGPICSLNDYSCPSCCCWGSPW